MEKIFKAALALFIVSQIVDLLVTVIFVQAFGPIAETVEDSRQKIITGGYAAIITDKLLGGLVIVTFCLLVVWILEILRPKITDPWAQKILAFGFRLPVGFLLLESWIVGFGPVLRGLLSLLE